MAYHLGYVFALPHLKKPLFIGLALLAPAAPVQGADWWVVSADGGDVPGASVTFVDAESAVRASPTVVHAWSLMIYMRPQKGGYISRRVLSEHDCQKRTSRALTMLRHRSDRSVASSSNGPFRVMRLAPGTVGEAIWKLACGTPEPDFVRLKAIRKGGPQVSPEEFAGMSFQTNEEQAKKKLSVK